MRNFLTLLPLLFAGTLCAQTPGSMLDPAVPAVNPMDPNGDGFITSTGGGFSGPLDETEFELPFLSISQYQFEPADDNQFKPGCEFYDLVNDAANGADAGYYYYKDPDAIPDNGDELLVFRFRVARFSNGATAFSILIDTDYLFGFTGPEADPNAVPGNPGFEKEVALFNNTGIPSGVWVYNVDGLDEGTVSSFSAPISSHYQVAYALNQGPGCSLNKPVFVDIYIPYSALGISASTQIRMAAAVNEDIGSSLGGGASDIGGVNGNLIPDDDEQFILAVTNYSPIAVGNSTNKAPRPADATIALEENSANGTVVHTVSATDPNSDILTYSITGGNTGSAFIINSSTGELTVNNSAALDAETNLSFTLVVRVSDGNLYDNAIIRINLDDVNEWPPSVQDAVVALNENSINGTLVYAVAGTDPDVNAVLGYSIIGGNADAVFGINNSTGHITVNDAAVLDFESITSFTLTIRVSDGDFFDDAELTINLSDINENPSVASAELAIDENSANATVVHTVTATDPDAGTLLNYSIVGGNTNTAFAINSVSGEIIVNNASALDFETAPSFTLTVRASDGSLSADAMISISLNDVNEAPVGTSATVLLDENTANNTLVHTVSAEDPDAGPALIYSITAGNAAGAFAIDGNSGEITVSNAAELDFEKTTAFALTIQVTDGDLSDEVTIQINLKDINEAPSISGASVVLDENTASGTIIHTVEASDQDAGAVLSYAITSGNTGVAFSIDNSSGVVTVSDASALNFEVIPVFDLVVRVSDGNLFSDAEIKVNLNNVNEAPQVADGSVSLEQRFQDRDVIYTVVAEDPDANDVLSFSITGGNTNDVFGIEPGTGVITLEDARYVTRDPKAFDLSVSATDKAGLTGEALIRVTLAWLPDRRDIHPQKGFSPNGDDTNDFWRIEGIEYFPENYIQVFNRWGVSVFETHGYDNETRRWEGEGKGTRESESTYFYVIKVEDFDPLTGYLIVKP